MDIAHLRAVFTGDTSNLDRAFDSADRKIRTFSTKWAKGLEVKLTGDERPLTKVLEKANVQLDKFAAKTFSPKLNLNKQLLDTTLDKAYLALDNFSSGQYVPKLSADLSALNNNIRVAKGKLQNYAGSLYAATLSADLTKLRAALVEAYALLHEYAAREWTTKLDADSSGFNQAFTQAAHMGDESMSNVNHSIDGARVNASRGVNISVGSRGASQTVTELTGVGAVAKTVDGTDPRISVTSNGVVSTTGQLLTLHKVVEMIHSRSNIRFTANIDRNLAVLLPKVLGDSLHVLKSLETVGAAVHAITVPSLIGALGGLGAAFVPVAGAAASLAIGLGEGLVGAMGAVGMAAGLGGGALVGFMYAMNQAWQVGWNLTDMLRGQQRQIKFAKDAFAEAKTAVEQMTPGTQEYDLALRGLAVAEQNVASEQQVMTAMLQQVTPNIIRLIGDVGNLQIAWINFNGAITDAVAPTVSKFVNYFTSVMPIMQGHAVEMVTKMGLMAQSFLDVATSGQTLQSIVTILMGIKEAGVPAINLVGSAFIFLVNAIAPLVPYGLRVLTIISGWVGAAAAWSATADGQRVIGGVWAYLMQQALLLGTAAWNVAKGVWGIIVALKQAGIVDYMVQAFVNLTAKFASFTAVGTEGQSRLTAFFVTTKPILEALGRLFGEAVYQAYRIITAITGIETAAPGLSGIVGIIDAVTASLEPIANLIINNFTKLAPLIAPLITNIAKLAEVFLAAISPLLLFVQGLNYVFTWFTSLDPATQRLIAGMLSWVIVLGKLGILSTVIGWVGGFWTAITGVSGVVTGLVTKIPLIGGALAFLTGPIGIAVAVIAGLVAIGYALYSNWDSIRAMFDGPVGQSLIAFKDRIIDLASNGLSWLITKAQEVYNWFLTNWPVWKDTIITTVQAVWSVIGPMWETVVTFVIDGANQILDWFQTNWPLIQETVSVVWNQMYTVISTVMNAIWAIIQPIWNTIVTFWNTNHEQIKAIVSAAWTIISTVISTVLSTIGNVIKFAMQVITGDWAGAWETIKTAQANVWEAIKIIISAALEIVKNILWVAWNQILATASTMWEQIKAAISFVWETIKTAIMNVVGPIVTYLYGQWTYIYNNAVYYWQLIQLGIAYYAQLIYDGILSYIEPVANYLYNTWNYIYNNAVYYWNLVQQQIGYYASLIYNTVMSYVEPIVNYLYQKWNYVYNNVVYYWNLVQAYIAGIWKYVYDNTIGWASSLVNDVVEWFKGLPTKISNALASLAGYVTGPFQAAYDAVYGHSIVPDMTDGVMQEFNDMISWSRSNLTALVDIISGPFADANVYAGKSLDELNTHVIHTFGEVIDFARAKMTEFAGLTVTYITQIINTFAKLATVVTTVSNVMAQADQVFADYLSNMATNAVNVVNSINAAFSKIRTPTMRASGGTVSGYADGGIVGYAAGGMASVDSGGVGTGRRILAITNEAGPEAVIAKNMPKASQMGFLQTAASWFDSVVIPKVPGLASGGFAGNGTISRPNVTFNRSRSNGPSMGDFNVAINVNGADYADREALIEGIRGMAHDEFTALMNTMLNGAGQRRASMARGF